MSMNNIFKFECECGSSSFYLIHKPNDNNHLYFMCECCREICGQTGSYGVTWASGEGSEDDED